ncbi:MAG: hypothetical protein NT069_21675, partial [Planctomycetota bacterium]|nr:hypothetical protein [Planctomycetota bacterium]
MLMLSVAEWFRRGLSRLPLASRGRRRSKVARNSRLSALVETLETRALLSSTLGVKPLVSSVSPLGTVGGGDVTVGTITFTEDSGNITVSYQIDASHQADYELSEIRTLLNGGALGSQATTGLAEGTYSFSHTLPGPADLSGLSILASATVELHDVGAVGATLPQVGTIRFDFSGALVAPPSLIDSLVVSGRVPNSTDTTQDTVTFTGVDPSWSSGTGIRVVAGFGAVGNTGLVGTPAATDTTVSSTYFVRNLGGGTYSFHTTRQDAIQGLAKVDITASIPTTGEIVIIGENAALPYLGQTPLENNASVALTNTTTSTVPGSLVTATNVTADTVDLASGTGSWMTGDRVQVSLTGGGLTAGTNYYVRVIDADTVSFHTSWLGAQNNTLRVNLTAAVSTAASVNTVLGTDEAVEFVNDPGWATGQIVRTTASSGGLVFGRDYFVRSLGSGQYSFYNTQVNAVGGTVGVDPLTGRVDLTGNVTSTIFANPTTLSFALPHLLPTGSVVRALNASGGLTTTSNYYVRAVDANTISLHTSLANAVNNVSPIAFSGPVTTLLSQFLNGWCIDRDRTITSNERIVNIYSSYDLSSFPDTSFHPKDEFGTDAGILAVNTALNATSTDVTLDRIVFASATGLTTGDAV